MKYDCAFTKDNKKFRYRAAAIIVENNCVLFANNEIEDIYYSVGGAVHIGETAEQAVVREVFEETGVKYEIDYLAVIHENLFRNNTGILKGFDCHEISLYFMMKSRGSQILNSNSHVFGVKENMVWIQIESIDKYNTYPKFIKQYLQSKHNSIEHIISDYRSFK